MSKKLRQDGCESETDSGTADRISGNDYSQESGRTSAFSSGTESMVRDFDCSTSIYTLPSTCSSPYRIFSSADDLNTKPEDDSNTNSSCLNMSITPRNQFDPNQLRLKLSDQLQAPTRQSNSAPVFTTKRVSAKNTVNKLQSIEENEECCSSESSLRNRLGNQTQAVHLTPRSIEVPPKKMCIRQKTPDIPEALDVPEELSLHIGEHWNNGGNKRFSIGDREFILRKVNQSNMTCVSIQTKGAVNLCTPDFKEGEMRLEGGDSSNVEQIWHDQSHFEMNLPQSVDDNSNPIALEPNIIIIGSDEDKRNKKRVRKTKIGVANDENPKKNTLDILKDITAMTPDSFRNSQVCTPTYTVTTNYSDANLRGKRENFDLAHDRKSFYRSTTEIVEREIKTIEPDSDSKEIMNAAGPSENLFEMMHVKSYKSLLANYSSGVKPTRTFPTHFDDLETIESKDEDPESMKFKEKASEWLRFASNQIRHSKQRVVNAKSDQKNASIIDLRKGQETSLDYYMVSSSSDSSPICSDDEGPPPSPGVKASEIYVESDDGERCCNCFSALRLL